MAGPYIIVESGAPRIADELPQVRPNRVAIINRFWEDLHAFDEISEYRLSVADAPRMGLLARLLAQTVYNPLVPVNCNWVVCGEYDRKRVVTLVRAGLEDDDDIIQQWFCAPAVLRLLEAANSYAQMVVAVKCVSGEHEEDEEARRYADAILGDETAA